MRYYRMDGKRDDRMLFLSTLFLAAVVVLVLRRMGAFRRKGAWV